MTTVTGIDVAADVRPHLGCLVKAGAFFVARYGACESDLPGKILTREEAQAISAAGLKILPVWENGSPTKAAYFTAARGADDGLGCLGWARHIGFPNGAIFHFTVDYDASFAELENEIHPYFNAIEDVFTHYPQFGYGVGVYGSGMVCANLITWGGAAINQPRPFAPRQGWLARPKGWQGYDQFVTFSECKIIQGPLPSYLTCGLPTDRTDGDTAHDDYGAVQIPVETTAA